MANLNFRKDLVLGNQGETVIVEFLVSKGLTYLESNDDNRYDFIMLKNDVEVTYEVKTDVLCKPSYDTGNMFVEFKCRNKPSGIETSQAKWFVTYFKFLDEIWFIESDKLRKLIKDNYFHVIKNGGDVGSQTHGYLINRKRFKEHFKVFEL
jgi:Holliday junction resolvase-like predicted endonuclease